MSVGIDPVHLGCGFGNGSTYRNHKSTCFFNIMPGLWHCQYNAKGNIRDRMVLFNCNVRSRIALYYFTRIGYLAAKCAC